VAHWLIRRGAVEQAHRALDNRKRALDFRGAGAQIIWAGAPRIEGHARATCGGGVEGWIDVVGARFGGADIFACRFKGGQ